MKHPQNSRDAASLAPPPLQQNPLSALRTPAPTPQPRRNHRPTTQFHSNHNANNRKFQSTQTAIKNHP